MGGNLGKQARLQNWTQPQQIDIWPVCRFEQSTTGRKRERERNRAGGAGSNLRKTARGQVAAAGAGVWSDLGQPEGDLGRSGRAHLTHPARLDSLTPRFMDYSTCWNAQIWRRVDVRNSRQMSWSALGLQLRVGGARGCPHPSLRNGRPKFVSQEISLYPLSRGTVLCHCTVCSIGEAEYRSHFHKSQDAPSSKPFHSVTIDSNRPE